MFLSPIIFDGSLTRIVPWSVVMMTLQGFCAMRFNVSNNGEKDRGNPTQDPKHEAAQLFGHINKNIERTQQPSRIIVRDGALTNESKARLKDTELLYAEVKAENSVNRITAEANPRFFERVPKSAEFELKMTLNIFQGESEAKYLSLVYECLRLIQDDYIGGGGSRGNGQVTFKLESVKKRLADEYYKKGDGVETQLEIPTDLK